jgi:protein SCO1/2
MGNVQGIIVSRPAGRLLVITSLLLTSCGALGPARTSVLGQLDPGAFPAPGKRAVIEPPRQLTSFTLPSSTGQPVSLGDFKGRLVLMFFGYTHCPDVCPTTLGEFKQVKQQLGSAARDVAFVFVSVDGERDTPAMLKKYVTIFDPDFIGLSGTFDRLQPIAHEFELYARRPGNGDQESYFVEHTAVSYLLDRQGRLRMIYGYGAPPEAISGDIERLVRQEQARRPAENGKRNSS